VLAFYVDDQHLDMYTYKVETQHRRRWLATFDIAGRKIAVIYWVIMFQLHI